MIPSDLGSMILVRSVMIGLSARSDLDTSGLFEGQTWIGMDGRSRAPAIENTGSMSELRVGHGGSRKLSV